MMAADVPAPLSPILTDPDTVTGVPALARLHEQVATIAELVGDAQKQVRERLDSAALDDAGGAGVTRRVDGIKVIVTDPQPSPSVSDHDAFASWYAGRWPDEVETRSRVEVVDHRSLAGLLDAELGPDEHADDVLTAIGACLRVVTETLLPAKALDLAVKRAGLRCVEVGGGWLLIDPETGEDVPGTEVRPPGRQQVQVRPDREVREVAVAGLRAALSSRLVEATGVES